MYILMEAVILLLAAYGLSAFVFHIMGRIRSKDPEKHPGVRIVLLVKDVEEQIEYIVRNAVKYDLTSKVLSDNRLTILDMGSSDNTCLLLGKLQKDFANVEIIKFEDRSQIFEDQPIFSPIIK